MQHFPLQYLTDETILSFAKDILRPYACEWGTCSIALNSWRSYEKHIHHHCRQEFRKKSVGRRCHWRSCLGIAPSSDAALIKHVNLTHLGRLTLHCPLKDCPETFTHHQLLPDHFFTTHRSFEKAKPANGFLPHARPSALPVESPKQDLPPLPTKPVGYISLNETCCALRKAVLVGQDLPSQSQTLTGRGRKRRRGKLEELDTRRVRSKQKPEMDEESEDECPVGLGNIQRDTPKSAKLNPGDRYLAPRPEAKVWASIENGLGIGGAPNSSDEPVVDAAPMSFGFEILKKTVLANSS